MVTATAPVVFLLSYIGCHTFYLILYNVGNAPIKIVQQVDVSGEFSKKLNEQVTLGLDKKIAVSS